MKSPFEKCPYCGDDQGYYTKEQARGRVVYTFNFDGSEAENGDMYDGLSFTGGKYAYCQNCDKRLFRIEEPK